MTLGTLRRWTIAGLLGLTSATIMFFLIAPATGYPLEFDRSWAMAQISIPVLTGYLGTATQFAVMADLEDHVAAPPLLPWLVFGPMAIYVVGAAILLFAFWMTNRPGAVVGGGMSSQLLSTVLTALLGVVTATANIAVAYMFKKKKEPT